MVNPHQVQFAHSNLTPLSPQAPSSDADNFELVRAIVDAAEDRKGSDITVLSVADVSYLADYFIIVSGFSSVQVRAIARSIQDKLEETYGRTPLQVEGLSEASWILMDYGDIIVHVFLPRDREFYNLEAFWGHAERLPASVFQSGRDSIK